jgi:hypothetical protein
MKAEDVHLLFWLLGSIGVAGTIALFVAVPTAFALARFFGLVLSYRIGCAALALLAGLLIADYWRAGKDAKEWAARTAAFEAAQDERDKRIAQETKEAVMKEVAAAATENVVIDKEVKEFHDALSPVPFTGNPFRVGADAPRLCRIAGQAQCGPQTIDRRMPKTRRRATDSGYHGGYGLP